MSVEHYENFPVASWLCPPALRPAVVALYRFARTADDLADEGPSAPAQRLADLAAYRADLRAVARAETPSARWHPLFEAVHQALRRHALPVVLMEHLLDAFEQDVTQHRYASRAELLQYCSKSANPVGRLLLHLYGVRDDLSLRQSDAICTALQLINFWQDLGVDLGRGRVYIPLIDCAQAGVDADELLARRDGPAVRALVARMCRWAADCMDEGAPLATRLPGRIGWELRLVVQGGRRILHKIEALDHATLTQRPVLSWRDLPAMWWRARQMRANGPTAPIALV